MRLLFDGAGRQDPGRLAAARDEFGRELAAASRDEQVDLVFDLFYRPACDAAPKHANRSS